MSKLLIVIARGDKNKVQTTGECFIIGEDNDLLFNSKSMERGWNDNKKGISCIPSGEYRVVLEYSHRFDKELWEIKGVKDRTECKFHAANYWYQLNGCVSLGEKFSDINNDGYVDVTNSKKTMKKFHKALDGAKQVTLIIN